MTTQKEGYFFINVYFRGLANYSNNEIENEIEDADQIPVLETENNNNDERYMENQLCNFS